MSQLILAVKLASRQPSASFSGQIHLVAKCSRLWTVSRIIAGAAGGIRLSTLSGATTRPTTDRVREAVFSTLASWLDQVDTGVDEQLAGIKFLDLYAGSGAIGCEAASRGASEVVLVEANVAAVKICRENIGKIKLPGLRVVQVKVENYLAGEPTSQFDVIWLDPPYEMPSKALSQQIARVVAAGWLAEDGLIIVERSKRSDALDWPAELANRWQRGYGETQLDFAQRD